MCAHGRHSPPPGPPSARDASPDSSVCAGVPLRSFGSAWVRGVPRQADEARRDIPCCHAGARAPLLPVQRGRGGSPVPLLLRCARSSGCSVPSAGVAVTVRPVMSEQRCSGFLRRALTCAAGESTGTTGPIPYCFCFRPLPSCTASPSSRPSSGRADASHHKVTGRGGNEVFSEGAIRPSPLPRAARRQRGAGQWAPAPVTPGVQPPVTPQPGAARSDGDV